MYNPQTSSTLIVVELKVLGNNYFSALTPWKGIADCSEPCGGGLMKSIRMCIEIDGYNPPTDFVSCKDADLEANFECNVHNCSGKNDENASEEKQLRSWNYVMKK